MKSISIFPILLISLFSLVNSTVSAVDIKAGQQQASTCLKCHGQKGNSNNAQWPNLAGQQPAYLTNQLRAFREGTRLNPTMQEITENFSDNQINNLAAYFASLPSKSAGGDPKLVKSGKEKFSMCSGCHGASAEGRGMFPRLAGQHPAYISKQLHNFKDGSRKGGPMPSMAANLSDEDIKAIAAYLGSLK